MNYLRQFSAVLFTPVQGLGLWVVLLFVGCRASGFLPQKTEQAWQKAYSIAKKEIRVPEFPNRDFMVIFRSAAEEKFCRKNIQNLIEQCYQAGGGRVVVPPGNYLCDGPLHLRSNVNLHLSEGAIIVFDTIPDRYLPLVKVRWEGTVCWNYSPMVYAYRAQNIAITGKGTLHGQSLSYWKHWRAKQDPAKKLLRQMGFEQTPEDSRRFGPGFWLRPSLIELYECEGVLIEGVRLVESPFWTLHPVFSKNITLRDLTITGGFWNDDGIDPDSCEDVLITGCNIKTDDDAISIKAGRDQDAWGRAKTRNIFIFNCLLQSEKANALCIGSELSGGVERVFIEKCTIALARYGINFKTNNDRGGFVRDIYMRQIEAVRCTEMLLYFQTNYHSYRGGDFPTEFARFYLQDIHAAQTDTVAIKMDGLPATPIRDVFLDGVTIASSGRKNVFNHVINLVQTKQK